MNSRIVVFGDVIDDIVVVPQRAVRPDTDTASSIRTRAGGSAANAAAWMSFLGAEVDFVGMVGAGDRARHAALLAATGVTEHLAEHPTLPTGTIVVIVDGETRTMLTETGANVALTADTVTDSMLDAAGIIHFTGYSLFGAPSRADAVRRLLTRAKERGVQVSVDPGSAGFIADFGVERFLDTVHGATFLFPNLEEGRLLTGLDDPSAVALSLAQRFTIVALTLDTEGVFVAVRGEGLERVAASTVTIVDPIGAGDAFAAGFLAEWARNGEGSSMARAAASARSGVDAGALAVATIGGRPIA